MSDVRPINKEKYKITKHRLLELYHFCLQYNEWKEELKYSTDTVGAIISDGLPRGSNTSDSTGKLGSKRADLSRKCEVIEQTALEADADLYQYILKAVTNEGISFNYLKMMMDIPCGKKMYYDRRRKFYWLLSRRV